MHLARIRTGQRRHFGGASRQTCQTFRTTLVHDSSETGLDLRGWQAKHQIVPMVHHKFTSSVPIYTTPAPCLIDSVKAWGRPTAPLFKHLLKLRHRSIPLFLHDVARSHTPCPVPHARHAAGPTHHFTAGLRSFTKPNLVTRVLSY